MIPVHRADNLVDSSRAVPRQPCATVRPIRAGSVLIVRRLSTRLRESWVLNFREVLECTERNAHAPELYWGLSRFALEVGLSWKGVVAIVDSELG